MRMKSRLALLAACITTAAILLIPGFAPAQSGATTASVPECVPAPEICDDVDNDCDDLIDDEDPDIVGQPTWYPDDDGDSYGDLGFPIQACTAPAGYVSNSEDCHDGMASVNPAGSETCFNEIDDDCDGLTDAADPNATWYGWYADTDSDGYGDPSSTSEGGCTAPDGYIADSSDCNDAAPAIHPGATEIVADGIDQNCDTVDHCYVDADNDNYGTSATAAGTSLDCTTAAGASSVSTDCDDTLATVNPAASETCGNTLDDDCDGLVDDLDPNVITQTWYADSDGDGYGNPLSSTQACTAPTGYVASSTDCDDALASVNPGASETCGNTLDDDCNGLIDDAIGQTWYADSDGDGYGNPLSSTQACTAPTGYVANSGDCDDTLATVNPGAPEICGNTLGARMVGSDEDCDGLIDDADPDAIGQTWYADADSDGYGSASSSTQACTAPDGYVANSSDCDDTAATINPGATEIVADGIDQNCDTVDHCYVDVDNDNYGTSATTAGTSLDCNTAAGASPVSTDCDDDDSAIHPGATEIVADGIDQNCDAVDHCYVDADNDNYGTSATAAGTSLDCNTAAGASPVSTDCDDTLATVNPAASETCGNTLDDDCDGLIDDLDPNATGQTWYFDDDGDGFGEPLSPIQACTAPPDYVGNSGDCDDERPSVNPGAAETCGNALDDDCDGLVDGADPNATPLQWYADSDGDGYGNRLSGSEACTEPPGYVANSRDCDDTAASINPTGTEIAGDGIDQNCDGGDLCYVDDDNDNYGTSVTRPGATLNCTLAAGVAPTSGDCQDSDSTVHPGATEVVADGIDQNCDAVDHCYVDADNDNYGTSATTAGTSLNCTTAAGVAPIGADCDDSSATIHPGATEVVADGIDQNCDAVDHCYVDADNDDYGTTTTGASFDLDCADPGEASNSQDCDDTIALVNPAASEACGNTLDDDCDGQVNELCGTGCTSNAVPVVTGTLGPTTPIPLGASGASSGTVMASFTDVNVAQTHTCTMAWSDGQTTVGSISESEGSGTCSGDHTYAAAGVYPIAFTINDGCGNGTGINEYVVVYDPSVGFVTGGGWINSVPGAYRPDTTLSGRANFGFVSKYKKGATVPTGETQFQFHVADFDFDSTAYEWLVISGTTKAQFRGSGTVNGSGNYSFLLTAWDSIPDRFRIKIWDRNQGNALVYDNRLGVPPDDVNLADPQDIGGGSITIHKK